MSYQARIMQQDGGPIRLIQALEQGRPCWCYLRVSDEQFAAYRKLARMKAPANLHDFGEVLYAGWGNEPPAAIRDLMLRKYRFS